MSMPSSPRQSPRRSPSPEVSHPAEYPESTPRPPPEDSPSGEPQHQDSAGQPVLLRKTKRQTLSRGQATGEPPDPSPAAGSASGSPLPGLQPVRSSPAAQAAAVAVLRLRQPVTVSQRMNRPLLEEWIQQADDLANALPDAQSVLYRKFLTTNKPSANGTLADFTTFAEALAPLADELHGFGGAGAGQVQTTLGQLRDALVRLRATGLAGPPENDAPQDTQSEQWWEAVADLFQAAEDLTKASASTATAYRQLQDCKTILSTIYNHQDTGTQVWLASDGEPVAVAVYHENTNGIQVADIATCPQYLRAGIRGAGGALMEYLARLARARNGVVSLIALDKNVKSTYSNWGFVAIGDDSTMVLEGPALDKFLATHNAFEPDG